MHGGQWGVPRPLLAEAHLRFKFICGGANGGFTCTVDAGGAKQFQEEGVLPVTVQHPAYCVLPQRCIEPPSK